MSEKIYAYLLRLFPSAFRRQYGEESLQLFRDRLRDERGFFCRVRLSFDLIADLIGALPLAYRNSYAEVAPAASLTPRFDGVPSFQVLKQEPIRRGTIILAGVLSLTTALAIFTYVVERTTPYQLSARNGRISPINAVLERLNQATSPDSADSVHSEAPGLSLADISGQNAQPIPTTNAVPSAGAISPAPAASQPEHASRGIAVASSVTPGVQLLLPSQQVTLRNVTRSTVLSGRWTPSSRAVDGEADIPQAFNFAQDGAKLIGIGGPDSTQQYAISHGLVAGNSVSFELDNGRRRFLYDLKVEGKELRGTLSIRNATETRTVEVWLERAR